MPAAKKPAAKKPAPPAAPDEVTEPVEPQETVVDAVADPAPPADPVVDQAVSDVDDDSGLVTITRPIVTISSNGDWTDPFSGLRVHSASRVCSQSGAERISDDEAAVRVSAERAAELGA